jgi:hypothetical protein
MAQVIGRVCAPTGKYIKDGQERTRWATCGVLMQTDKGYRIKLDTIPVGGEGQGMWFSVFEDDQGKPQGSAPQAPSAASQGGVDGDLPF